MNVDGRADIGPVLERARATLAKLRVAKAARGAAELAKGICNQYGCWDEPGAGKEPGGGASQTRPDGKPYYQPPPAPGAPNHPWERAAPPPPDPTAAPGSRGDAAAWQKGDDGLFRYTGDDDYEPPPPHEWPEPSGTSGGVRQITGDNDDDRRRGTNAVISMTKEHPVAAWVLQAHPLERLTVRNIETASGHAHAFGTYNHASGDIQLNPARLDAWDPSRSEKELRWGQSFSMTSDAKTRDALTAGVVLHELGHHLSTYPGVERIMSEGFAARDDKGVSEYAKTNRDEYFAESFAAYNRDREEMKWTDFNGHQMIERALAVVERGSTRR